MSVESGAAVGLSVSATSAYHVEAYRIGSYGAQRATLVWTSATSPGLIQPRPVITGQWRMVTTRWRRSTSVLTRGWQPGYYLLKLVGTDGAQSWIPLIVRSPPRPGALLVVLSPSTWQAYNIWGGVDLYDGPDGSLAQRSRAVTFDRPYGGRGGRGAVTDMSMELPLVSLLEGVHQGSRGIPLAYAADIDLELHPELLAGARGVLVLGHSEYWSPRMRAALVAARNRGVHLAFLGANDVYWRARLEPGPSGPDRVLVCYKNAAEDPSTGVATTALWDDPPAPQPTSLLTGQTWGGSHIHADMRITDPRAWLVKGTGVHAGSILPGLVGTEFDHVVTTARTVAPIHVVAHSPLTYRGVPDAADLTWYSAPSGALVVDVGTMGWGAGLDSRVPAVARFVRTVTTNIATRFAQPQG